jgi:hypothetical protein
MKIKRISEWESEYLSGGIKSWNYVPGLKIVSTIFYTDTVRKYSNFDLFIFMENKQDNI